MKRSTFRWLWAFCALLGVATSLSHRAQAQQFYEMQYERDDVTYIGLLVYYDDNDAFMRVKYREDGIYRVAEFQVKGQYFESDGQKYYLLDGQNAKIVYGEDDNYSPNNFVFTLEEGQTKGVPYTMTDQDLDSQGNQDMLEVEVWRKLDPRETFTEEFVYNYFEPSEPLYATLTSMRADAQQGNWAVVMQHNTGMTDQLMMYEETFPRTWMKENQERGYYITTMTRTPNNWYLVMSKGSEIQDQTYTTRNYWPEDWVEEQRSKGYFITEVANHERLWTLVASKGKGFTDQKVLQSSSWPREKIKAMWAQDYYITEVEYGAGTWTVIMSQGVEYTNQSYILEDEWPIEWLEEQKQRGFLVNCAEYGSGKWVMVVSSGIDRAQVLRQQREEPSEFILRQKRGGYMVTSVVFGIQNTSDEPEHNADEETVFNPETSVTLENEYLPPATEGNTTLHLIMVANTEVVDIGASCTIDKETVTREFKIIAQELGIGLNTQLIVEDTYSKEWVERAVDQLKPGQDDIVVFIYTGHGFRWPGDESMYPRMDLTYSRYQSVTEETSMQLEEVYQRIVGKGARLNIVLGDLCNNEVGLSTRAGTAGLGARDNHRSKLGRLATLFLEAEGDIIASSSEPGQTSCGSASDGGYFLTSFFSALHKETSYLADEAPNWDNILHRAMETAAYKTENLNGCTPQNGIYKNSVSVVPK